MQHKNCGGSIVMDLTSLYVINSPALNITTKGVTPGMIQIDSNPKKTPPKFLCMKCGETFSSKEEYESEFVEMCQICEEKLPPSRLIVTDYLSRVCDVCVENNNTSKKKPSSHGLLLTLYGEAIRKGENPTLLTVLMKK